MNYKIRKARFEDAKGISKVHIKSWKETYRGIVDDNYIQSLSLAEKIKNWGDRLKTMPKNKWMYVATDEKESIVGFIFGGLRREKIPGYKGELYALYLLKKHQGKKIGSRLVKKLCIAMYKNGVKSMYVSVLRDNESKLFYQKMYGKFIKSSKLQIGKQKIPEEYYGWKSLRKLV